MTAAFLAARISGRSDQQEKAMALNACAQTCSPLKRRAYRHYFAERAALPFMWGILAGR